jgi:hypothetical protein
MRRATGRSFMISLSALACVMGAVLSLWPAALEVRTEDLNRDGRPDVWRVYNRRGQVASVSVDTNFDGRSDVQEYYDGGALVRRESDRDFDDQIDLVQEFDAATRQSVRSVTDVDFDGSADLLVLFEAGRPVSARWKSGFTPGEPHSGGGVAPLAIPLRTADNRLVTFLDPFSGELAIRPIQLSQNPGEYIGTAQSGGLPRGGDALVSPSASAPHLTDGGAPAPASAAIIPHSPRGPPAQLLS